MPQHSQDWKYQILIIKYIYNSLIGGRQIDQGVFAVQERQMEDCEMVIDAGAECVAFFFPPFCLAAAILLELSKLFREEGLEIGQMYIHHECSEF